ncbi:LexA family transcriptional regulator [Flavobacterium sp. B183]|uniref:LexA family transcriptional regulator n=1 Tax=Flavobacterium sp. B183 TaxID=907046 RepID=UPI00201E81AA|nr:LexA family transcriptional regulator [Flavobacterium sp. B183]URC13972.1 helix-turn-helix domain-containing protein [Flavobacterium sp. B183]URC14007.1 helix-turn-helix domain-containing protein [Flavobacterium sp. B183]
MSTEINKSLILNDLKAHYGFDTDSDFADFLGIKRQTLSSWHTRNTFDIDLLYAKCVNVDGNFLLTGKGTITKRNVKELSQSENVTKTVTFSNETKNKENVPLLVNSDKLGRMPAVVTVDRSGKDNVVLVPAKAAAGYLVGFGDPDFVETLPTFSLPNINNGTFRMFQVSGHSMFPTLSDACYVVAEWVENWNKDIKDNRIYVVVSNDGILIKRVLNRLKKYDNLYLKSDNRKDYPNMVLETYQIKEVWAVKMHLSFDLPDPAVLYDRVGDLEAEIDHIKSLLKGKN